MKKKNLKLVADPCRPSSSQHGVTRLPSPSECGDPVPVLREKLGGSRGTVDARILLMSRLALPVPEVAKLLGISSAAVRLMIHRGALPGKKVGGGTERVTYIIPTGALLSWLDEAGRGTSEGAA